MKVIVLDDARNRVASIRDAFSKKKMDAIICATSNEFMAALDTANFTAAYINADTWNKGRSIYDYFGAGARLENKPITVYNADERFAVITNRDPHDDDCLFSKPSDIESVLDAI